MNKTILALVLSTTLFACSDNKAADLTDKQVQQYVTQPQNVVPAPQETQQGSLPPENVEGYSGGEMVVGAIAGAAVGALAANALSSNKSYEVERCDYDDKPWEPECRGTSKYYKWKAEQDRKAKLKAQQRKKSYYKTYKRKPR